MAQGPSDTILVAIRITLRIRESKIQILRIGGGLCSLSTSSFPMHGHMAVTRYTRGSM